MLKLSFLLQGIKSDGIKNTTEIQAWRYIFWRWFLWRHPWPSYFLWQKRFFCDTNYTNWYIQRENWLEMHLFHSIFTAQTYFSFLTNLVLPDLLYTTYFLWHVTEKSIINCTLSNMYGRRIVSNTSIIIMVRVTQKYLCKFGRSTWLPCIFLWHLEYFIVTCHKKIE